MMLRRSLQTFMNAMTYPDRMPTPLPPAQDFNNLLSIYLDASFAPNLMPWTLPKRAGDWPPTKMDPGRLRAWSTTR